jgi:hypothetical protein
MSPAKRMYEPRIFEGRVMLPEEQEQIYEEIIQFERMEYVSPQMGELIMDVWPELAHKGAAERGLKPLYCFVTTIVARLARRDGPDSPLTITRPWPADPGRGFRISVTPNTLNRQHASSLWFVLEAGWPLAGLFTKPRPTGESAGAFLVQPSRPTWPCLSAGPSLVCCGRNTRGKFAHGVLPGSQARPSLHARVAD